MVEFICPMGIKLTGVEATPEFMENLKIESKMLIKFSKLFESWIKDGLVKEISGNYVHFNQPIWDAKYAASKKPEKLDTNILSLRHIRLQAEVKKIINSTLTESQLKNLDLSLLGAKLWYVVERYKSYVNRNSKGKAKKFPKKGIELKTNKAVYFKEKGLKIDHENNLVIVKTLEKKKYMKLPFESSILDRAKLLDSKWKGGNIVLNSLDLEPDNLTVFQEKIHSFHKLPSVFIGIDVNRTCERWIACTEPFKNGEKTIEKPQSIQELEVKRDEYNRKLRPSKKDKVEYKLNSEQKRKMYGRNQKVERHRKMICQSYLEPELDLFKDTHGENFVMCIDGVATGRDTNSFGQEHVRDVIANWCKKNNILCIIVPPQYTSQRCPKCGEFHKQNRTNSNNYFCPSCGYFNESCDDVGALNIREYGKFLIKHFGLTSPQWSTKVSIMNPDAKKNPDKPKQISLVSIYKKALKESFSLP